MRTPGGHQELQHPLPHELTLLHDGPQHRTCALSWSVLSSPVLALHTPDLLPRPLRGTANAAILPRVRGPSRVPPGHWRVRGNERRCVGVWGGCGGRKLTVWTSSDSRFCDCESGPNTESRGLPCFSLRDLPQAGAVGLLAESTCPRGYLVGLTPPKRASPAGGRCPDHTGQNQAGPVATSSPRQMAQVCV